MSDSIRFIDLFGGIGGFRHGLEKASDKYQCVDYIEKDKYAVKSYNAIFNEQHEPKDATKIQPENLPDFELLCAGFPCQAFSIAGNRGGFEDTRGTLFFEIARIAKEKLPKILLLENVKGLLNHADGETFKQILSTLDELGYNAQWQVLNSKYHGVPQNRERVFIVASRGGEPIPEVFPFREPDQRTSGESEKRRIGVRNQRGDLQQSDYSTAIDANYFKGIDNHGARTAILDWHGHKDKPPVLRDDVPTLRAESHGHQPKLLQKSHDWRKNNELRKYTEYSPTIRKDMGDNLPLWLQNNSDNTEELRPMLTPERLNKRQNGRRMKENKDPMYTLTKQDIHEVAEYKAIDDYNASYTGDIVGAVRQTCSASAPRNGVKLQMKREEQVRIRKLTPRECWRLQGFPDWAFEKAEKENSDTQLYKQAGNAVTVNVIEDLGENIVDYLASVREKGDKADE